MLIVVDMISYEWSSVIICLLGSLFLSESLLRYKSVCNYRLVAIVEQYSNSGQKWCF